VSDVDPPPPGREVHLSYRVAYDIDRVRAFSDAVFGVAITIVVITFVLPDHDASDSKLASDLLGEWPRFLSYLAAFAVIGYTWVTHHQVFEVIRRVDTTAVWINLALLSFVVLTPYPMQLVGRFYDLSLPFVLFNLDAFLFGLLNWLVVAYATRGNRLVSKRLTPATTRILRLRSAVFPVALGVATLLAVPFGSWSVVAWVLIPIGRWAVSRLGRPDLRVDADDAPLEDETARRAEQLESESSRSGRPATLATVYAESGSLTRLIGFSDNVYAFAITLLVLQFSVPIIEPPVDNDALRRVLTDQFQPDLIGYFVGFAVIGLFWIIHHRDFLIIERQDAGLRAINLVHLMFIAVMPFATLVISTYEQFVSATVLYAVCAGLASISLLAVLVYATQHHRLVDPGIPWSELQERRRLGLIAPGGFILSIPVAFASPLIAQFVWLLPFVGARAFRIRQSRREASRPDF
jgi:uncharacterized membrane protein